MYHHYWCRSYSIKSFLRNQQCISKFGSWITFECTTPVSPSKIQKTSGTEIRDINRIMMSHHGRCKFDERMARWKEMGWIAPEELFSIHTSSVISGGLGSTNCSTARISLCSVDFVETNFICRMLQSLVDWWSLEILTNAYSWNFQFNSIHLFNQSLKIHHYI